jgi:aldose 1-epimerase
MKSKQLFSLLWLAMLMGCISNESAVPGIEREPYGKLSDGTQVYLYTLSNRKGMVLSVTSYGGRITSLKVPDKAGNPGDVVLGFDSLEGYLADPSHQGSLVGRYANRIARGRFSIDGQEYSLACNNGLNHLHGGEMGFDRKIWMVREIIDSAQVALELSYTSRDGEEGYPGNLSVKVLYSLNLDSNELKIDYQAETDKPTVVNLTNHAYINLSAGQEGNILNHVLRIPADSITPVDSTLIPTGNLLAVEGTPFDFRKSTKIGSGINDSHPQLIIGNGYDHNFVLNNQGELALAAELSDSLSGRILQVYTTKPGIQFYSGNFLDGSLSGNQGREYSFRYALCLEPHHFPDSPNKPQFESPVLRPGEKYHEVDVYKFLVKP